MRLNPKFTRVYINGYDVSGTARNIGTVGVNVDAPLETAYSDNVKNTVLGQGQIKCGPVNAFLSPVAAGSVGLHELLKAGTKTSTIMVAMGTIGEPAVGEPAFGWTMEESEYNSTSDGIIGVNVAFPDASYLAGVNSYVNPFGLIVHPKGAETAANAAVGTINNLASSALGGIFFYQLFSSDGTVTLSIDDSATNANNAAFAALSGATSGSIDASVTPKFGMVALSPTATVRQYLRWQIAKGTATTATFALGFIRGA